MARKKRRRGYGLFTPIVWLLGAALSLIDFICEGIGSLAAMTARGILFLARLLMRGVFALLRLLMLCVVKPIGFVIRKLSGKRRRAEQCLRLDGAEFEDYAAQVLRDNGFKHVEQTRLSGDQGVDILAERNGIRYAIQCKNYHGSVGNAAVQEAYAGMVHYDCDAAAVLCPGDFTRSARELAESTGVELWDGERLSHLMHVSGRKPRHKSA